MCHHRCFNTQPPEGGWIRELITPRSISLFQHSAARRRLGLNQSSMDSFGMFQHSAARRRLDRRFCLQQMACCVSTLSRPKAAGRLRKRSSLPGISFNTQPPEGGWLAPELMKKWLKSFNTQPPEGGWVDVSNETLAKLDVSTLSRPKAAGTLHYLYNLFAEFQHSAARRRLDRR